jgi:hypothetical protein
MNLAFNILMRSHILAISLKNIEICKVIIEKEIHVLQILSLLFL